MASLLPLPTDPADYDRVTTIELERSIVVLRVSINAAHDGRVRVPEEARRAIELAARQRTTPDPQPITLDLPTAQAVIKAMEAALDARWAGAGPDQHHHAAGRSYRGLVASIAGVIAIAAIAVAMVTNGSGTGAG